MRHRDRRLRNRFIRRHPRCFFCGARGDEVDHAIPLRHGGADTAANLRTLCRPCHARVTARDRRAFGTLGFERLEWDEFIERMTEAT